MYTKTDPAIKWLAQLVAPLSPEEFLSKQAASLLAKSGQSKPPFNPQKALPPTVKCVELVKLSRDGMLIPVQGGFIIKINSLKPLVRQNFTCAHEIGHTFFYDVTGERPWRPYKSMSTYWGEEGLCYEFAEEMLMPRLIMEKTINSLPPSVTSLQELLKTFQVSTEAMLRRISRLNLWPCIFTILEEDKENPKALRRKLVSKNRRYRYYNINWDMLLSEKSSPYTALKNPGSLERSTISCSELFRRGKKDGQCSIESFRLSGASYPAVICIIVPDN
jgi:Zn-dependent peptidase ImmA (M78 family)